jgi:[ribosomal protein S5]-alanine N-acetyltransferase
MDRIVTSRLDLVASTLLLLEAELESNHELASMLGARVPDGWPPGEYDQSAMKFFRDRIIENPDAMGWLNWYALWRLEDSKASVLVGGGGFMGPPDTNGIVEIGYSVVPAYEGRGFATEIVRALVEFASSDPRVTRIIAHTSPQNIGSTKVLERIGFSPIGPGAEDGMVRFERRSKPI